MKIFETKIDKTKDAVNVYKMELSYGQLLAIRNALGKSHADPVSDELFFELDKYLELLPRPGEEKGEGGHIVPQGRKTGPEGQAELGQSPRIEDRDLDAELPNPEGEDAAADLGPDLAEPEGDIGPEAALEEPTPLEDEEAVV